ncbi:polymeric immunoglobulin receptor-like [Conger conger]|uniref:polymeric immunoglobulin receptor-like n=1 Tax=Conger conger TaxID=82655 RepID=UPI002A5ADEF9|nr:polymeric immunoglobulin receptor-like [Conger conger]
MTKLKMKDSGNYWCAVDIQGAPDKGAHLRLSATAGPPGLWVEQQEVAGVEGGHVSVPCHYNEPSSMKKWCRIKGSCLEVNSGKSGKSGRSEMKDDRSKKVFTVTVRELNMEDTGWYWCAAGELQIPVHLTVTRKTTTTTVTTPSTAATSSKSSTSKHSTVSTPLSPVPATTSYNKSPSDLTIILMALGMLLLVAAVATGTWKLCKRYKGVQPHTGAREDRSNELTVRPFYTLHSAEKAEGQCQLQTLKMK